MFYPRRGARAGMPRFTGMNGTPPTQTLPDFIEHRDGWYMPGTSVLRYESPDWITGVTSAAAGQATRKPNSGLIKVPVTLIELDSALCDIIEPEPSTISDTDDDQVMPAPDFSRVRARRSGQVYFERKVRNGMAEKVLEKSNEGKLIFVVSNQSKIGEPLNSGVVKNLLETVEELHRELGIPVAFYAACKRDMNRSPSVGLWDLIQERLRFCDTPVDIDLDCSSYIGSRVGREEDSSNIDLKFALNVGLHAVTPERFMGKESEEPVMRLEFQPRQYVTLKKYTIREPPPMSTIVSNIVLPKLIEQGKPCLILLHGGPCSGKSHFVETYFREKNFNHIRLPSRHSSTYRRNFPMKDMNRQMVRAWLEGRGVVLEGTNGRASTRKEFVQFAHKNDVPAYCFSFKVDEKLALHLFRVREVLTEGSVPSLGWRALEEFECRDQPVTEDEGFDAFCDVTFRAHFKDEEHKIVFTRYT